jgi:YD repeat-containing protein
VTGRGGEQTLYSYRKDPLDPRHTFTTVTTVTPEGGRTSREYEYQSRTTETGAEQVARFAAGNGANRAETLFDAKGRVIRKAGSAGEPVEYVYDTRSDKLVLVLSGTTRTEFHYDAQGNLTRAAESTGREIELEYGANQRIDRIVDLNRADGERRELRFRYNAAGKPVEIHLVGTGRITVAYDGQGEITKVESDQGMRTALQVTQVFQNLLGVVRVAGVRLDM